MKWHLKLFVVLFVIATAIHFFGPTFTPIEESQHTEIEEYIIHYEVTKPKDVAEANTILQERTAKIADIIAKEALDNNDLEKIHEHTYSLEAAVDKLRAEKAYSAEDNIDYLDEAVQALHYASENHEETNSREWFGRLKVALANL